MYWMVKLTSSEITVIPQTYMTLTSNDLTKMLQLIDTLQET
jgi:transcriptional/translational regulatory protein YebC/TACO1